MARTTLVRLASVIGIVLALLLAGGAPNDIGVRGSTTLVISDGGQ